MNHEIKFFFQKLEFCQHSTALAITGALRVISQKKEKKNTKIRNRHIIFEI